MTFGGGVARQSPGRWPLAAEPLSPHDGHRLAAQVDAIADDAAADASAASRCLISDELVFVQLRPPIRCEGAVRRAGDWVLVDPDAGREEEGHEVAVALSLRIVIVTPRVPSVRDVSAACFSFNVAPLRLGKDSMAHLTCPYLELACGGSQCDSSWCT